MLATGGSFVMQCSNTSNAVHRGSRRSITLAIAGAIAIVGTAALMPTAHANKKQATDQKSNAPLEQPNDIKNLRNYLKSIHGGSHPPIADGAKSQIKIAQKLSQRTIDPRDDLLIGERELSKTQGDRPHRSRSTPADAASLKKAEDEHLKLFVENRFPSAATCGVCHPKHYAEWSVSQHAYAQLSPIYLSLNNKINKLSNGSNGDFCLRCHSPVGGNLGESPFASNLDRHPTSREGITCVVCHRVNKAYNKVSGRLALVEGGLTDPVFGPTGNKGVNDVLKEPQKFRVVTDEKKPGRKMHARASVFESIKTPTFCGSCHDVTLFNGFRLEEAFSEYRLSPAAAKGITCQDCHMGKIQGKPSGYATGPAAVVGDVPTQSRKLTSHLFSGPDYSVIHPGIFPHNQEAAQFKTMRQWLQFKHEEGWGTDKFEKNLPRGYKFPKAWVSVDDRYDAREILNKQFEMLEYAERKRLEVLKNGFVIGDVIRQQSNRNGLAFRVKVMNATDGHNVPTGFTGERLVWLHVRVRDDEGQLVFESGGRDPNGDLLDGHSSYVHAGRMQRDPNLFSLQSIFVTQNGRGGEIEHVIPIPYPTFALPRVLPSTTSLIFTGEPATERNHKKGIEPLGHRWAS
ncbi:MAG: multiheme c-type cytochrome, partial [Hyphomicrobiaceae bacterium]